MQPRLTIRRKRSARATTTELRKGLKLAAAVTLELATAQRGGDSSPGGPAEISLLITDDKGIQELNRDWRDKDQPTDVLSFPLEEEPRPGCPWLLGDIVINYQRCQSQGAELGHSYEREFVFLFVHGLLHLLGYDHELGPEAEAEMFSLQRAVMSRLEGKDKRR